MKRNNHLNRTCLRTQRTNKKTPTKPKKATQNSLRYVGKKNEEDANNGQGVHWKHYTRRETLTRDRNNENEDTEERALDISTMPQLQSWMQKNPTAVLEAITAYRESEISAVTAYNEANDNVGQLQEAYEAQDETIQELNHQIIDLQGQLGEQVAIVKHQRIQLNEAAIAAAAREREGTPTTVGSSSGKSTKLPDAPILTDGKEPQFTAWLIQIQGKLDANADHL